MISLSGLTTLLGCARVKYSRTIVSFLIPGGRINPRHSLPRDVGLLSDADVLQYLGKGEITIDPFDPSNLTPNGYDVSIDQVVIPAAKKGAPQNRIPPGARFAVSTRETIRLGR